MFIHAVVGACICVLLW